ncbi:MAG: Ger(x)C family spore germination protein [Bacillota bacterium]|nr:Ger(x)C family spore germination protein [Bacillota bacterium]
MKCKFRLGLIMLIIFLLMITTGCWNYREVDKLFVVAGVAFDKGKTERYAVTVEAIYMSGGKDTKMMPKTISAEGKTMFDAVRNIISVSGKRLYWSDNKVVIISKDIASEGVTNILDWIVRDSETREDTPILVSRGETAKEIFGGETTEPILSFALNDILENEKSLGKAQIINISDYEIASNTKGASVAIPAIHLKQENEKKTPEIMGTAIIKNDKFAGFLDGEETKCLYFIRDEITYGVLTEEIRKNNEQNLISLEILKSKTKVTPIVKNNNIKFNIDIETRVAIDEINGKGNFFSEKAVKKLEKTAETSLTAQIEAFIKKMQLDYDADIFGFATKLWEDNPKTYKRVIKNWDEIFKGLQVHVQSKIIIENSALKEDGKEMGE